MMKFLITILLSIPLLLNSQLININGLGTQLRINGVGAGSITINRPYYSPIDYTGTINNTLQNLTENESELYYYGWPMSYAVGQKRSFVIRRGDEHGNDPNSDMIRWTTSNGANTWVKDSIFSEPGYDIRNYGGGSTSEGIILIFYGRWAANSTWTSMRCMRSTDGGTTFTHSSDLQLYPDSITTFSPHGRLVELDNGDLLQSFYGIDNSADTYIYTLKSTDKGISWGDPVLIHSGTALYEPSLVYLGNGKLIAGVRHDFGTTNKDLDIYNSSDYGATWDSIGKCLYTPSGFDLPGVSPLLLKKDADNATIIATARQSNNNFIEVTLPFGTSSSTSLRRVFFDAHPDISGNNIEFGYPAILSFNGNDTAQMIAFYDASTRWVSGEAKTDVLISPVFRKTRAVTQRVSSTITSGNLYTPTLYIEDELPVYNVPTNSSAFHKIREGGNYAIRIEATFTGGGTTRTLNVNRYTTTGTFIETMNTETGAGNSFDFSSIQIMTAGQLIGLQVVHDASPLTVTLIRVTIDKQ